MVGVFRASILKMWKSKYEYECDNFVKELWKDSDTISFYKLKMMIDMRLKWHWMDIKSKNILTNTGFIYDNLW